MQTPSSDELVAKLWNSLPKFEQENLSHETFAVAVKLTRMEMLDDHMDFYDEGFDAGYNFEENGDIMAPGTFKKTVRVNFTNSLPD